MNDQKLNPDLKAAAGKLVADFDRAWNERDADALAELFTEGADFLFYNGLMLRGRDRIWKYYKEEVFQRLPEGWIHTTRSFKIRPLSETVILGDGEANLVDENEQGPDKRIKRTITVTTIAVKEGEDWRFTAVRLMMPEEK